MNPCRFRQSSHSIDPRSAGHPGRQESPGVRMWECSHCPPYRTAGMPPSIPSAMPRHPPH